MKRLSLRFLRDESGATAIEYGLVAVIVSVGIIGAAEGVRNALVGLFQSVATALTGL
jgi:pilus assembly protein Flp/PilA